MQDTGQMYVVVCFTFTISTQISCCDASVAAFIGVLQGNLGNGDANRQSPSTLAAEVASWCREETHDTINSTPADSLSTFVSANFCLYVLYLNVICSNTRVSLSI